MGGWRVSAVWRGGSAGRTPFTAFRASSLATWNEVELLLAAPAFDLALSARCLMLVGMGLGVEKLRAVLAHAVAEVSRDAGVESSLTVADVHVPPETTSLEGGFWLRGEDSNLQTSG